MLLSMYCPNGRVGKTTTSLAFAHEAQNNHEIDTCVLEFDFSPGDISPILKLDPAKNILDAADGNFDIAIQRPTNENFDVVIAGYPDYPEQLKSEDVIRIIEELESRYSLVIVDIQPNFIEQVIDILQMSDKIILVLNNEEQGVTRVLNNIDWGIKSGYMDESKFEVLVNKFNKKDKVNFIAEAQLQYPVLTTIPVINNFKGYSDERFTKYMGELINVFFPDTPTISNKKKGLFSGLFGKKKNKKEPQPITMQLPPPKKVDDNIIATKQFEDIEKDPIIENKDSFNDISELIKENKDSQGDDKEMIDLGEDIFNDKDVQPVLNVNSFDIKSEKQSLEDTDITDDSHSNNDIFELVNDTVNDTPLENINNISNTNSISDNDVYIDDKVDDGILNEIDDEVFTRNEPIIEKEQHISSIASEKDLSQQSPVDNSATSNNMFDFQNMLNSFIAENTQKLNAALSENEMLQNQNKVLTESHNMLEKNLFNIKKDKTLLETQIYELTNTVIDGKKALKELEDKYALINKELQDKTGYILLLNNQLLEKEKTYTENINIIKKKISELSNLL